MGGLTGKMKNDILRMMFAAEQQGRRVRVKELAERLGRTISTISEHIAGLAENEEVRERQRGEWELTTKGRERAQSLQLPPPTGIEYRGLIAAGPAIPLSAENLGEYLPIYDLDSDNHFALRVKGTSMVGYGILNGDIVILRAVTNWLDVPDGAIIAALVPEGTDVEADDWLERLEQAVMTIEGANPPSLDYVTLKKLDARLRSYLSQGVEQQRVGIKLKGSQGNIRPLAAAVAGVVVRLQRDFQYRRIT
jgi:SOS-response transcriptional repressor LexA